MNFIVSNPYNLSPYSNCMSGYSHYDSNVDNTLDNTVNLQFRKCVQPRAEKLQTCIVYESIEINKKFQ